MTNRTNMAWTVAAGRRALPAASLSLTMLFSFLAPAMAQDADVERPESIALSSLDARRAGGLLDEDFVQIGEQSYGEEGNSYTWAMTMFKGKLYIGTNRYFLCTVERVAIPEGDESSEIPGECPSDLFELDLRARIITYDPRTKQLEQVWRSPMTTAFRPDGTTRPVAADHGYRTMAVFKEPDGTEALYVGTWVSPRISGPTARILRSTDGITFEEVKLPPGDFPTFRSLTVFGNRLFVLAVARDEGLPGMLELRNPEEGFIPVIDDTFGDPVNTGAFELAEFGGHLYVGTFALNDGYQLLRTKAVAGPPYVFERVLTQGAFRGQKNQSVVSLMPYKNQLYVGSGVWFGSLSLIPGFRPSAAEIVRVDADGEFDVLVGEERDTPAGYKDNLARFPAGFGNGFTGYMWRMAVHNNVLYMGTLDTSVLARYSEDLAVADLNPDVIAAFPGLVGLLDRLGPDEVADIYAGFEGGFDLWQTTDGERWFRVTNTGFGDEFSYGVRQLRSTKHGLFLGTANPFLGTRLFLGQRKGTDTDGDTFPDVDDNCPLDWNLSQYDTDGDGIGDKCDDDIDGDCIPNSADDAPMTKSSITVDTDGDGILDGCDVDDDDDGVLDRQDNCPLVPNFDQRDADGDGFGDACDESTSNAGSRETGGDAAQDQPTGDGAGGGGGSANSPTICGAVGIIPFALSLGALGAVRFTRRRRSA